MMIDYGVDWGTYSCSGWADAFGTSYPILDGEADDSLIDIYSQGIAPHHVVIDHNMEIIYSVNMIILEIGIQAMILVLQERIGRGTPCLMKWDIF